MELSVFVDESGDFGEYDYHAPYYIISLVFHNQSNDIQSDLSHFNDELAYLNLSNHCVHAGPIIRSEEEYRRQLLKEEADFWFNGKAVDMVASICESQKLEDDEVKRIKKILNGLNK